MTFLVHDVYVNAEPLLNAYCKNKNNHFVQNVFFYEWNLSLLNLHVFVMKILLIISSELVWCFKYNFFVLIFLYFSKHRICILSYWMNMPYAWMIPRLSRVLPSKNHFNLTITIYLFSLSIYCWLKIVLSNSQWGHLIRCSLIPLLKIQENLWNSWQTYFNISALQTEESEVGFYWLNFRPFI